MSKRATAVAETRQRIVGAALELHGEKGIAATSWDDIAVRAGVGVGTVYRHFPSLEELVPACGESVMQLVGLPDMSTVPALFQHATTPAARIERLVREIYAIYERAAPAMRAIRQESEVHQRVKQDRDAIEASMSALLDEALEPLDITREDRAVARAMIDLNIWEALRDQGFEASESVIIVAGMIASRLTPRR